MVNFLLSKSRQARLRFEYPVGANPFFTLVTMLKLWLLVLLPALLVAQTRHTVVGRVVDEAGQSVEFATVSVLNASDSTLIKGGVAGTGGLWEIQDVPADRPVILRASFMGYEMAYSGAVYAGPSVPPFELRLRSAARILDEIEVTGK